MAINFFWTKVFNFKKNTFIGRYNGEEHCLAKVIYGATQEDSQNILKHYT
jgi:hypothetical protein